MKKYWLPFIFIGCFLSINTQLNAASAAGTVSYTIPGWFKDSFLELQEDSKEASENNKHVILFMHLEACPYCSRMLDENFRAGNNKSFIQKYFDVIAINILGDREIAWDDETQYIEKTLARELKVRFTPTIVFLNAKGQKVLQLNGYRKPAALKHALNYVNEKQYFNLRFADYVKQQNKPLYSLKSHPSFSVMKDFSAYKKPLAIIFENRDCAGCDEFHNKVLNHPDVLQELESFKVVRLDTYSDDQIIDIDGNKTTAANWAKELKLDYRPGTVLFDNADEITRADGRLYHFHYKELLRYVSNGQYFEYASYNQYLRAREKQLRQSGVTIDYSE